MKMLLPPFLLRLLHMQTEVTLFPQLQAFQKPELNSIFQLLHLFIIHSLLQLAAVILTEFHQHHQNHIVY